jgi:MFS family permease
MTSEARTGAAAGTGLVLLTLATGQFLMTLDMSVMNVSIATVAKDVGTTVTGIQTAITLYTLVMATLMLTGGRIGTMIGRRRAFMIGCVIYGVGSFTTAIAPNLGVLILGWSFLEGVGAALIMPAIVALVAGNFPPPQRPRAYGLVASAGAIAVAAGPLLGGLATTYATWRLVFLGEVVIVLILLVLARRIADPPPEDQGRLDLVGSALSIAGLGMAVFGVLRSGEWGWVHPKAGAPEILSLSPVLWLILGGLVLVWLFFLWETHLERSGGSPLVAPSILRSRQLTGGLTMFFFQFFIQAGVFFAIPLFLSVALGLSAVATGVRLMPLSITLLVAAAGVPKVWPNASPRRVVRVGLLILLAGIIVLIASLDHGAGPEIVTVPLLLMGLGVGALASQLGAVTVSAVGDEQSGEVGGLQNTATNLGASLGTALVGSVLIAVLSANLAVGISENPAIPHSVAEQAAVKLEGGVPFVSDAELQTALDDAGVPPDIASAAVDENSKARIVGLQAGLSIVALMTVLALFFTGSIPALQPGSEPKPGDLATA